MNYNFRQYSIKRFFLIIFSFLLSNAIDAQQWVQTRGPGGGDVSAMLEKSGAILAATPGGIFRTTDNGDTWIRSGAGFPPENGYTEYLAATTNNIYTASFNSGLFKSSDNGITWSLIPINLESIFILDLFASNDTLYIGLYGGGVIRSINDGATFERINNGFPASAYVVAFAQVGQYLFCGLSGNGGTVGIYRTPVNAINWTQMNTGFNATFSIGDITTKGTDLFTTTSGGLFRSTNLGDTWFQPSPGFTNFGSLTVYHGDIYTGSGGDGVFRSTNNGATWTRPNTGLKSLTIFSLLPASTGLFIGFERGVALTTNDAASWNLKTRGLTNTSVTGLLAEGNRIYATTRTTNLGRSDGVFFTDDGGQNWIPLNGGLLPNPEGKTIIKSGNNLILGTMNNGLFIKRPADTGFIKPPTGISFTAQVDALVSIGPIVLAGTSGEGEMYRSTDFGETWVQSNTGFRTGQEDQVASLYNHNGVIYAGAFNALYKSTDLGLTWTNSYTGIYPGAVIAGITSIGNDLYAVDNYANGVYKSTNNGASWFNVNNGLSSIGSFNAIISFNGVLYAASDYGVFQSANNGDNWSEFNDGLSFYKGSRSIAVLNNRLFLGTDQRAVWGRDINVVLPISLQSFTAKENSGIVNLHWQMATEINGYFDVQRSGDGQRFTSIGSVNTTGNSYAYSFNDVHPNKGSNYYRIMIVDREGNKKYSSIAIINLKTRGKINMVVIPNPSAIQSTVNISGDLKGTASIKAYDVNGRLIANLYSGEMNSNAFSTTLNLSSLRNGVYFIKLTINGESLTRKVVIQ